MPENFELTLLIEIDCCLSNLSYLFIRLIIEQENDRETVIRMWREYQTMCDVQLLCQIVWSIYPFKEALLRKIVAWQNGKL